ncbi:hypothetical protein [Sporosarcina highlanderae]|uniref:DUF8042 domain-containing protein n=1 Tax=Sporosarcina highlanderae TaxID=3035916 RepID=A0ABT8JQV2_9BACL|nr:hypothetical protein [Sporosarcina highlanderae]MDN4606797.1 hypothetical protein [Sporosarcina highlanderae]
MAKLNELIEAYNEYISKVPKGCQFISDNLREDNILDAMTEISHFAEGANWLSTVCRYFMEKDISDGIDINKVTEYLMEVNRGLELKDYIVVADMFEYEIQPFFERFSNGIKMR